LATVLVHGIDEEMQHSGKESRAAVCERTTLCAGVGTSEPGKS